MGSCAFDLVAVVVQSDHVAAREGGDFPRRFPNTTSNIQYGHMLLDPDFVRKVMFVTSESLQKGLPHGDAAEMEGLRPSLFIEIGGKIIVAARV